MNKKLYKLVFIALFIATLSACTTTTKTLSREVSVSYDEEVKNANTAFNQKNYIIAAELLKPLAERGRGDAQYALGYLYFNGLGVARNESLAAQWFNSAAANGNENAKQALRLLPPSDDAVIDLRDKKSPTPDSAPVLTNETDLSADIPVAEPMIAEPMIAEPMIVESNVDQPSDIEKIASVASDDVNMSANGEKLTDGEKWIAEQPSNNFTIQLIVSDNEPALQKFINKNNLQENSVYYRIQKNGKRSYALVYGSFESYSLAKEAITGMSPKLKKENPWIRNISSIQKLLSIH